MVYKLVPLGLDLTWFGSTPFELQGLHNMLLFWCSAPSLMGSPHIYLHYSKLSRSLGATLCRSPEVFSLGSSLLPLKCSPPQYSATLVVVPCLQCSQLFLLNSRELPIPLKPHILFPGNKLWQSHDLSGFFPFLWGLYFTFLLYNVLKLLYHVFCSFFGYLKQEDESSPWYTDLDRSWMME